MSERSELIGSRAVEIALDVGFVPKAKLRDDGSDQSAAAGP